MKRVSLWALLVVCLCGFLLAGRSVCGAPPSVEALGQALGYPSDQLVVTDVTAKERDILRYKLTWKLEPAWPDLAPERILEAYRVTAKDGRTFHPIVITIAEEGTFFSPRSREIIDLLEAHKDDPPDRGGGMGWYAIPGVGEGGIFLSGIRVPSRDEKFSKMPFIATAVLSEIRVPALKQEIRIAIMAALDVQGQDELIAIPGGEAYFATFGRDEEGRKMVGYKTADLFTQLGRAVFESLAPNQPVPRGEEQSNSTSMENTPTVAVTNDPIRMPATTSTPDTTSEPGQEPGTGSGQQGSRLFAWAPAWFWWGMGFVVAAGALWGIRQSRR